MRLDGLRANREFDNKIGRAFIQESLIGAALLVVFMFVIGLILMAV